MTTKTLSWVAEELFETMVQGKVTYYVNCAFFDEDTASIGKQDQDKALEIKGLLTELLNKEADFILDDTGKKNKKNGTKWKLRGFPGYEAPVPFVPGSGGSSETKGGRRPLEHDQFIQERMDRRTALMQAVTFVGGPTQNWRLAADFMYAWLRHTSGSPAPEAAATASGDPEPTSQETLSPPESDGGGKGHGEGSCPPHQPDPSAEPKLRRRPCLKCKAWVL